MRIHKGEERSVSGTAIRSDRHAARLIREAAQLPESTHSDAAPAIPSITDYLDQLESLDPGQAACLPDFLVISPPKTGSTWLARNLSCHPGVFVPECKEVDYFSSYWRWLGLDWYLNHFRDAADLVKGEASPSYSILPVRTIRLVRSLMPDLKLIFLMRDPVGRAWSHARHNYRYHETNFANCTADLDAVPDTMWRENFVQGWALASGDYLGQLRRWMSVFPREQIYVGFYESIACDPESLLRDILAFLGVEALPDLSSLPLSEKILGGLDKKLPPNLLPFLRGLLGDRTAELAAFLREEFNLTLPKEWQVTVQEDSPADRAAGPCIPDPHFPKYEAAAHTGTNTADRLRTWERSDDDLDRLLRNHAQCIGRDWASGTPKNLYLVILPSRIDQFDLAETPAEFSQLAPDPAPRFCTEEFCPMMESTDLPGGSLTLDVNCLQLALPDYASLRPAAETPQPAADASGPSAIPIEHAGWLPVFAAVGEGDRHPAEEEVAPDGYGYLRTGRYNADEIAGGRSWRRRAVRAARLWSVTAAASRLLLRCWRGGASVGEALEFLRSRGFRSQLMLPRRRDLVFLPGAPLTYGQHPWIVEVDDVTSLFFPFVRSGHPADLDINRIRGYSAVKMLLESESCRNVITCSRSTAEAIPHLFDSETITGKTVHVPLAVPLPTRWQRHDESETVNLLFTGSPQGDAQDFYVRGGLDVLDAFSTASSHCPQLRLVLRTRLPQDLRARHREITSDPRITILDETVSAGEMDHLSRSSHVYLHPSARVHARCLLRAMSYGLVPVVSDGRGMSEYVEHDHNGLVLNGRDGKLACSDERPGPLREDRRPMHRSDPDTVRHLVAILAALVENRTLRRRLGSVARRHVERKFSLARRNRALKKIFDRALSRN